MNISPKPSVTNQLQTPRSRVQSLQLLDDFFLLLTALVSAPCLPCILDGLRVAGREGVHVELPLAPAQKHEEAAALKHSARWRQEPVSADQPVKSLSH